MKACILGLSVLSAVSLAARSQAAINVANPSFENDQLAPGTNDFAGSNTPPTQVVDSWSIDRNDVAVQYTTPTEYAGTHDGNNFIFMNGGIIHQDLGTMVAGQTYSFDVSYAWRSEASTPDAHQFAFILRPSISSATALVESNSPAFTEGEPSGAVVTVAPYPVATGVLQHDILTYTATPADNGQPLTIQLQTTDLQLLVDQVALTTSVPEPASLGALGLSAVGLMARRRRA